MYMIKSDKEIILVGDRVLIDPDTDHSKTPSGLYLPPGVKEKENVQGGYVVKVGPGFPIPMADESSDEPWAPEHKEPQYIPLQAEEGDYAIFLRKYAIDIELEGRKYVIVPHSYLLVLIREDFLDE
ncbi:MAG: co-chaperone GroES family protein [Candidatus Marinimicrobia bacterium]|nr:co-chaperone GroES family protein [Candidatus Neomarinimicrobiota bacterium]